MYKMAIFLSLSCFGWSQEASVSQISEAIGHMIGKNLENLSIDFDLEAIVKGLKEEAEGKTSPLTEDECVQAIASLQEEKINHITEQTLLEADALSNGDQVLDEDHSLSTPDSSKRR